MTKVHPGICVNRGAEEIFEKVLNLVNGDWGRNDWNDAEASIKSLGESRVDDSSMSLSSSAAALVAYADRANKDRALSFAKSLLNKIDLETLSSENHYNALAGVINGMGKNPEIAVDIVDHMIKIGFNAGAQTGIDNGGEKDAFEMIAEQAEKNDHPIYPHQLAIAKILLRTKKVAGYKNSAEFEVLIKNLDEGNVSLKELAGHASKRAMEQRKSDTQKSLQSPDSPNAKIENPQASSLFGHIFSCFPRI